MYCTKTKHIITLDFVMLLQAKENAVSSDLNTLTAAKFSRYTLRRFIVKAHILHILPICQTTE